jgi:hypothetical protein
VVRLEREEREGKREEGVATTDIQQGFRAGPLHRTSQRSVERLRERERERKGTEEDTKRMREKRRL